MMNGGVRRRSSRVGHDLRMATCSDGDADGIMVIGARRASTARSAGQPAIVAVQVRGSMACRHLGLLRRCARGCRRAAGDDVSPDRSLSIAISDCGGRFPLNPCVHLEIVRATIYYGILPSPDVHNAGVTAIGSMHSLEIFSRLAPAFMLSMTDVSRQRVRHYRLHRSVVNEFTLRTVPATPRLACLPARRNAAHLAARRGIIGQRRRQVDGVRVAAGIFTPSACVPSPAARPPAADGVAPASNRTVAARNLLQRRSAGRTPSNGSAPRRYHRVLDLERFIDLPLRSNDRMAAAAFRSHRTTRTSARMRSSPSATPPFRERATRFRDCNADDGVVVSHEMAVLRRLCGAVWLANGAIVDDGPRTRSSPLRASSMMRRACGARVCRCCAGALSPNGFDEPRYPSDGPCDSERAWGFTRAAIPVFRCSRKCSRPASTRWRRCRDERDSADRDAAARRCDVWGPTEAFAPTLAAARFSARR